MPDNSAPRLHCSFQGYLVPQQHTGRGPSAAPCSAKAARGRTATETQLQQAEDTQNTGLELADRHWALLGHSIAPSPTAVRVPGQGESRAEPQGH